MRIGGLFPFSVTDAQYGGGIIELGSGGVFYLPPGNFLLSSGLVTNLQSWDPVQQLWRNNTVPQIDTQIIASDGANWRLYNQSGVVIGAAVTAAGSGGANGIGSVQTGVTVAFSAPTAPGLTATGYAIVGGAVVAPTVNTAGTGFLYPPLVVIDPPPPGGIQATAIATLTAPGGGIAGITMTNPGAGYTATNPGFYLIPQFGLYPGAPSGSFAAGLAPPPGFVNPASSPPGVVPVYFGPGTAQTAGALLNPATLTGSGTLTGIVIVGGGSLYTGTTIPAVSFTGGTLVGATATALMSMSMTGISNLVAGAGYTGTPPLFETSLGDVLATLSGAPNGLYGNVFDQRPARGVTTIGGGNVLTAVIEDPGFGFQKVPTMAFINAGSIASTQATATPVVGGINDVCLLQARASS